MKICRRFERTWSLNLHDRRINQARSQSCTSCLHHSGLLFHSFSTLKMEAAWSCEKSVHFAWLHCLKWQKTELFIINVSVRLSTGFLGVAFRWHNTQSSPLNLHGSRVLSRAYRSFLRSIAKRGQYPQLAGLPWNQAVLTIFLGRRANTLHPVHSSRNCSQPNHK
jgi:hypothetical protein